jgi:hypothetical protein
MKKNLPSPEILRKILRYDPEAGKLFWRQRPVEMFNDTAGRSRDHACAQWNAKLSGKEALISVDGYGYKFGRIFGSNYRAHRVIFAIITGAWPDDEVDHIDGNRCNNRRENLRSASRMQNSYNRKTRLENVCGLKGVRSASGSRRWTARIQSNGKRLFLGSFGCKTAAHFAYVKASVQMHGEFGRPGLWHAG